VNRLENIAGSIPDLKTRVDKEVLVQIEKRNLDYNPWLCFLVHHDTAFHQAFSHKYPCSGLLSDRKKLNEVSEFLLLTGVWEKSELVTGVNLRRVKSFKVKKYVSDWEIELHNSVLENISSEPLFGRFIKRVVNVVVPVLDKEFENYAFSTILARGAILISIPSHDLRSIIYELNLVHEFAHQILYLLQCVDTIIEEDQIFKPIWSGIRQQNRPAIKTLHGLVAMVVLINHIEFMLNGNHDHKEIVFLKNHYRNYFKKALESVESLESIRFTEFGLDLFIELKEFLKSKSSLT